MVTNMFNVKDFLINRCVRNRKRVRMNEKWKDIFKKK